MQKKTIIFDFFGVVCAEVSARWFATHLSPEEESRVRASAYLKAADLGETTDEVLFKNLSELSGETPEAIRASWGQLVNIDTEVVALLAKLKETHRIGLCSNAIASSFWQIVVEHHLAPLFDSIVVSSEVHLIKPDPRIYTLTLDKLGTAAKDTIFFDDRKVNVDAAAALGIESYIFTDAAGLRETIVALGL